MRYVFTLLWAVLISSAVSYILTSMANEPFNVTLLGILAVIIFIVITLIDVALSSGEKQTNK